MQISKTYTFEAAHQIPNHSGKCRNLHGHSYVVTVYLFGVVNRDTGMVLDYAVMDDIIKPVIDRMDHSFLQTGRETQAVSDPQAQKFYDMTDQPYTTAECIVYHLLDCLSYQLELLGYKQLVRIGVEVPPADFG